MKTNLRRDRKAKWLEIQTVKSQEVDKILQILLTYTPPVLGYYR